ncbi:ribosomal protein L13 [Acrasis kona]|uniref:Ribosomal protein L13 n=1 Tax=Acrasis kona TaxID=1008807 RepID=A0AAW2YT08_9EUKA
MFATPTGHTTNELIIVRESISRENKSNELLKNKLEEMKTSARAKSPSIVVRCHDANEIGWMLTQSPTSKEEKRRHHRHHKTKKDSTTCNEEGHNNVEKDVHKKQRRRTKSASSTVVKREPPPAIQTDAPLKSNHQMYARSPHAKKSIMSNQFFTRHMSSPKSPTQIY